MSLVLNPLVDTVFPPCGVGGFALVFKAKDVGSGRVVALKRIMVNNQHDLKLAKQEVAVMVSLGICSHETSPSL